MYSLKAALNLQPPLCDSYGGGGGGGGCGGGGAGGGGGGGDGGCSGRLCHRVL